MGQNKIYPKCIGISGRTEKYLCFRRVFRSRVRLYVPISVYYVFCDIFAKNIYLYNFCSYAKLLSSYNNNLFF